MQTLKYLGRFGFHGGKLLARVLMILLPVVGAALWKSLNATAEAGEHEDHHDYGVAPDGTPWVENVEHEDWQALYGKDVRRV